MFTAPDGEWLRSEVLVRVRKIDPDVTEAVTEKLTEEVDSHMVSSKGYTVKRRMERTKQEGSLPSSEERTVSSTRQTMVHSCINFLRETAPDKDV